MADWSALHNTIIICQPAPVTACQNYPIDDTNTVFWPGYGTWHTITVTNGFFDRRRFTRNHGNVSVSPAVEVRYFSF